MWRLCIYMVFGKNNILNKNKINPETLTALTLFIAESNPTDKNRVIGLILQLLRN